MSSNEMRYKLQRKTNIAGSSVGHEWEDVCIGSDLSFLQNIKRKDLYKYRVVDLQQGGTEIAHETPKYSANEIMLAKILIDGGAEKVHRPPVMNNSRYVMIHCDDGMSFSIPKNYFLSVRCGETVALKDIANATIARVGEIEL